MKKSAPYWEVEQDLRLPPEVTVVVAASWGGLQRIFVPGRLSSPGQIAEFNRGMMVEGFRALEDVGFDLCPEKLLGIPIPREGFLFPTPFYQAVEEVWGEPALGILSVEAKRRPLEDQPSEAGYIHFQAKIVNYDQEAAALNYLHGEGTLVLLDIGATGSTQRAVVPFALSRTGRKVDKAIFMSPCASLQTIRAFVEAATKKGISAHNLAVVANVAIFSLGPDGTALWIGPEAITSPGSRLLSELIYPPRFCHIGSGGDSATCYQAYLDELREQEEKWGSIRTFNILEDALREAGVEWPEDFGSPF